jgi:DNA-nicking Smr family endonuclease
MTRRFHRPLDPEDASLWDAVARTVTPLRPRTPRPVPPPEPAEPRPAATPPAPRPHPAPTPALPPLAPLGRRELQRLGRGQTPIERRLDLHGYRQHEAHERLAAALRSAQAEGARVLLVITGKGGGTTATGDERGVLRRLVPLWLQLPAFRPFVIGFEEAHIGHGGQGALYVRLRRRSGS